jgi:hypothetical protein
MILNFCLFLSTILNCCYFNKKQMKSLLFVLHHIVRVALFWTRALSLPQALLGVREDDERMRQMQHEEQLVLRARPVSNAGLCCDVLLHVSVALGMR